MNAQALAATALVAALMVPKLAFAQEASAPAAPAASAPPQAAAAESPNESPRPTAGSVGVSFGFPAGGAPTLGASYFLRDTLALKVDLGLDLGTSKGQDFTAGFSVEGGVRSYLAKFGPLSPFVQPGLFLGKSIPPSVAPEGAGPSFGDLLVVQVNAGVGAEYFFNEHFSASALTGVGLRMADAFDTVRFTTGTSGIYVNLYW